MPKLKQAVLLLVVFALGAAAAGGVFAATQSDDVRVAARKHADGRVEVALQQAQEDGTWGERQLPELRFMPADAPAGQWLTSSALQTAAAMLGETAVVRPVCLVHHGSDSDEFWLNAATFALGTGNYLDLAVTVHGSPDHAQQAQLIRDCADNGAAAIATSVPNADALRDAISYAQNAQVLVLTFNSGAADAESLNVPVHVALDEQTVGRLAGNAFNDAGVEGIALCILHEPDNSGLEERCDALGNAYAGELERLYVVGVENLERSTAQIAERLSDTDQAAVGAMFTLNSALMNPAVAAKQTAASEAKIGAIGTLDAAGAILTGNVLFAISDQPGLQISYTLANIRSYLGSIELGLPLATFSIGPTTQVLVESVLIDFNLAQSILADVQAAIAAADLQPTGN